MSRHEVEDIFMVSNESLKSLVNGITCDGGYADNFIDTRCNPIYKVAINLTECEDAQVIAVVTALAPIYGFERVVVKGHPEFLIFVNRERQKAYEEWRDSCLNMSHLSYRCW